MSCFTAHIVRRVHSSLRLTESSDHVPVIAKAVQGKVAAKSHSPQFLFRQAHLQHGTYLEVRDTIAKNTLSTKLRTQSCARTLIPEPIIIRNVSVQLVKLSLSRVLSIHMPIPRVLVDRPPRVAPRSAGIDPFRHQNNRTSETLTRDSCRKRNSPRQGEKD